MAERESGADERGAGGGRRGAQEGDLRAWELALDELSANSKCNTSAFDHGHTPQELFT